MRQRVAFVCVQVEKQHRDPKSFTYHSLFVRQGKGGGGITGRLCPPSLARDLGLKPDLEYYIRQQLKKPIEQFFEGGAILADRDVQLIFDLAGQKARTIQRQQRSFVACPNLYTMVNQHQQAQRIKTAESTAAKALLKRKPKIKKKKPREKKRQKKQVTKTFI